MTCAKLSSGPVTGKALAAVELALVPVVAGVDVSVLVPFAVLEVPVEVFVVLLL
jgi:hypothetical protein